MSDDPKLPYEIIYGSIRATDGWTGIYDFGYKEDTNPESGRQSESIRSDL